jgi:hypothetical protein
MQAVRTEPEPPRRGFLRGLLSLPLIGGGVTLIGAPTAVAEPVSQACLESYLAWLHYEFRFVHDALYPGFRQEHGTTIPLRNAGANFHFSARRTGGLQATTAEAAARAPVVLAAVGCDWRG